VKAPIDSRSRYYVARVKQDAQGVALGILRKVAPPAGPPFGIGDPCVYCAGDADTWEHIIPRSAGGGPRARACRLHNQQRGSMPLLHYLLMRQQLEEERKAHRARTGQDRHRKGWVRVGRPTGVETP
jgi:hypothetical protein